MQDPRLWYQSIEKKCQKFQHINGIESFVKHAYCYSAIKDISNWQGIEGELNALENSKHVVGVNQVFRCDDDVTKSQVDVVAGNGLVWLEVKTCNNSTNFLSNMGFERQARRIQAAAKSECNQIQFTCPKVLYYFPMGNLDPCLEKYLKDQGFYTAVDVEGLQKMTDVELPCPSVYNFDVSSMLDLCSELSNAQGTVHTIFRRPNIEFIAHEGAIQRVESMLNDYGSNVELKNWKHILENINVLNDFDFELTPKIKKLVTKMTLSHLQLNIYGLGDAKKATTITTCYNVMRKAQSHNCPIQHLLHTPIPLSGTFLSSYKDL